MPRNGNTLCYMGNEKADAVRAELRSRLLDKYGDLHAAAEATGTPYKTLYRNLTVKGSDRNKTISLDWVIDMLPHVGVTDFASFYADALKRIR